MILEVGMTVWFEDVYHTNLFHKAIYRGEFSYPGVSYVSIIYNGCPIAIEMSRVRHMVSSKEVTVKV